jgi:hypothetical protein
MLIGYLTSMMGDIQIVSKTAIVDGLRSRAEALLCTGARRCW